MSKQKVGRNDTCICGSGKKFKNCCEGKAAEKSNAFTKWTAVILGSLMLLGVLALLSEQFSSERTSTAPAGKVWSAEHNHWH